MAIKNIIRSVSKLLIGNGASQLLSILFLPVIALIYQMEEIAFYGIALATSNVLAVVISMRMELNIVDSKSDLSTSFYSTILFIFTLSVVSFFLYYFFLFLILHVNKQDLILVPLMAFLYSLNQVLNMVLLQLKKINLMSCMSFIQTALCFSFQYFASDSNLSGLVLGYVFSYFLVNIFIYLSVMQNFTITPISRLLQNIRLNFDTAKFAGTQAIINYISQSLPYWIFPIFFNSSVLAQFYFADKIFRAPLSLIGQPIRNVFMKYTHDETDVVKNYYVMKVFMVVGFSIGFSVLLINYFFSEALFKIFFHKEYHESFQFIIVLSVWGCGVFSSYIAMGYLRAKGFNKFLLKNEMFFLLIKFSGLFFMSSLTGNFVQSLIFYSVINLIMTISISVFAFKASKSKLC